MKWFKPVPKPVASEEVDLRSAIHGVHQRGVAPFAVSVALIIVTMCAAPAANAWPMCGT